MYKFFHFSILSLFVVGLMLGTSQSVMAAKKVAAYGASEPLRQACNAHCHYSVQPAASPQSENASNNLMAIEALSARNVWAVGQQTKGSYTQALIEHWDGTSWRVVPSPYPGPTFSILTGITAISANDIWAVGWYYIPASTIGHTLIEHWNGTTWHIVTTPNPGPGDNILNGIVAVSANDIWAVGWYSILSRPSHTLVEHWDGTDWQVVPSPTPGTYDNRLMTIKALSTNDIWTVGMFDNQSGPNQILIEHWNGTSWRVVPSPNPGTRSNFISEIAAVSANNIWAVGQFTNISSTNKTLIEHWDGTSWCIVPSPSPGLGNNLLSGIVAISANDIWTAGRIQQNGDATIQTLLEHWNGSSWLVVPGAITGAMDGITAVSARTFWAIGSFDTGVNYTPVGKIIVRCHKNK